MNQIFNDAHRAIQDKFETRKLADHIVKSVMSDRIGKYEKRFIEGRNMFFLSTVDHRGQPTVSYKGGDVGFVRVLDETTLAFPSYDGNGMHYSMGNLDQNALIGLLFIDFETPHRLRLHGAATIDHDDPLLNDYAGAQMIVRVRVSEVFVNCPRYVHRMQPVEASKYVPRPDRDTPRPAWKDIDTMQDALPERDRLGPDSDDGTITIEEYREKMRRGDG